MFRLRVQKKLKLLKTENVGNRDEQPNIEEIYNNEELEDTANSEEHTLIDNERTLKQRPRNSTN